MIWRRAAWQEQAQSRILWSVGSETILISSVHLTGGVSIRLSLTAALNPTGQVPFAICRIPGVCEQQWRPKLPRESLAPVLGASTLDFIFPVSHKVCDLPSEGPFVLGQLWFVF